ncbi:MAG TPA: class II aldolase/adducin family protein [Sediminispirochaeta sp.]|nr:class II aldolase/adducin family protein [Sediminispirochaeta sp.]
MNTGKKELQEQLADFSRRSFNRHLIGGTGGNNSVRIPESGHVLITPSGISLADVEPDGLIECTLDGEVIEAPKGFKPSKETSFHLGIYKLRPEVNSIFHVHPPYSTGFANLMEPLPMATVSAAVRLKHVPCVGSALPGSDELRELILEAVEKYPESEAFILKEHGIVALGPDIPSAFYTADLIEDTAKIAFVEKTILAARER